MLCFSREKQGVSQSKHLCTSCCVQCFTPKWMSEPHGNSAHLPAGYIAGDYGGDGRSDSKCIPFFIPRGPGISKKSFSLCMHSTPWFKDLFLYNRESTRDGNFFFLSRTAPQGGGLPPSNACIERWGPPRPAQDGVGLKAGWLS